MATDKQINTSFNNSHVGKIVNEKQQATEQSREFNRQLNDSSGQRNQSQGNTQQQQPTNR
jgi:hypothetical protein